MDKIVEVLLEYNADPYIKDSHYFTPMHTAAYSGHQNIVVIMLEHGVDPNVQTALEKYTALHLASMKNFYEVAQVLVKYGICFFCINSVCFKPSMDAVILIQAQFMCNIYFFFQLDWVNLSCVILNALESVSFKSGILFLFYLVDKTFPIINLYFCDAFNTTLKITTKY